MFAEKIEKTKRTIITQRYVTDVETLKNNTDIPLRTAIQDIRVNTIATRLPLQMVSVLLSKLSKEQEQKLTCKITTQLTPEGTITHDKLQAIIQEVAWKIKYDESDLQALEAKYSFTIKDEAPSELTETEIIQSRFDETFRDYDIIVLRQILFLEGTGRFTGTDDTIYYHKTGHSTVGKPIWTYTSDQKIHICGMYKHSGGKNKQYKKIDKNNNGPKSIIIKS